MAEAITMTIAELAEVLQPSVTGPEIRAMVKAARIKATGWRGTGKPGHPWPEYDYAAIAAVHKALLPWLAPDNDAPDDGGFLPQLPPGPERDNHAG